MTAVVVPARNEAATIGNVLAAIAAASGVSQIIVADDGSDDETAEIASRYAEVVALGAADKGSAMSAGLSRVTDALTLFLDADLVGLRSEHVSALAQLPPLGGQLVGITDSLFPLTGLPPISGQRRLPSDFLRKLNLRGSGYRVELSLDAAVGREGLPWRHLALHGVRDPSRSLRHPLMWPQLGVAVLDHFPGLVRYSVRGASSS
jgi:glycosyltransferase involved in cell wall biosynthesis